MQEFKTELEFHFSSDKLEKHAKIFEARGISIKNFAAKERMPDGVWAADAEEARASVGAAQRVIDLSADEDIDYEYHTRLAQQARGEPAPVDDAEADEAEAGSAPAGNSVVGDEEVLSAPRPKIRAKGADGKYNKPVETRRRIMPRGGKLEDAVDVPTDDDTEP